MIVEAKQWQQTASSVPRVPMWSLGGSAGGGESQVGGLHRVLGAWRVLLGGRVGRGIGEYAALLGLAQASDVEEFR